VSKIWKPRLFRHSILSRSPQIDLRHERLIRSRFFYADLILLFGQITSGERANAAKKAVEDSRLSSSIEPLRRARRNNLHDHRTIQYLPSTGDHGNRRHANQQRRGPAHPLQQTASVHRHINLESNRPLVRRKRVRRAKSTPSVVGNITPALQRAPVSYAAYWPPAAVFSHGKPGHDGNTRRKRGRGGGVASGSQTSAADHPMSFPLSTAHHPPLALLSAKSKPQPEHATKTHRRKIVHKRGRGHSLLHSPINLDLRRRINGDHDRGPRTPKSVRGHDGGDTETSPVAHHQGQKARDQLHSMSGPRDVHRSRSAKIRFPRLLKHPISNSSLLHHSIADEIHAHPVAIHHRFGAHPRRRAPASGSGERRRRPPVVRKSVGRSHHGAIDDGASHPLKHAIIASRRRRADPRIRIVSDG